MSTDTLAPPGSTIAEPEMADTKYGVAVAPIGDDGDTLALGHPGKWKALAAFNWYARSVIGLVNVADDRSARANDLLAAIEENWGLFNVPDPEKGEDPDMTWYVTWCTPETPGAQPVTLLRA